jgi:hypothetical protein
MSLGIIEVLTLGLMMVCEIPLMFLIVLNANLVGQQKDLEDPQMTPNEYDHVNIF